MTIREEKARVYKDIQNQWVAESISTSKQGQTFIITTHKGFSANVICTCHPIQSRENKENFRVTKYGFLHEQNNIILCDERLRATEKAIRNIHAKGLLQFDYLNDSDKLPVVNKTANIQVGQLLHSISPENEKRLWVYKIENNTVYYLNPESLKLGNCELDYLRSIEQKFGIGIYYVPGQIVNEQMVQNFLISAENKKRNVEQKKKLNEENKRLKREKDIQKGSSIISFIPEGVKGLIVAELNEDISDVYTDYFDYKTSKIIYLDFTYKTREDFKELRKAANNSNIEGVKQLAKAPKEFEHREKWSMGAGYYLGKTKYSGYSIRKVHLSKNTLETLQIAAANGDYFIPNIEKPVNTKMDTEFKLIDYSEKSFVVVGNTKPIKDDMKRLGGRFNARLKHPETNEPIIGWVFPKTKTVDVLYFLKLN